MIFAKKSVKWYFVYEHYLNFMKQELLNEREIAFLTGFRAKELEKQKRKFIKRKKNHLHNEKLHCFFNSLDVEYSHKIFDIKFYSTFTFYLYLYLKANVKIFTYEGMPDYFRLALSQDVNFSKIARLAGVSRSSVRKAYDELIEVGMIIETPHIAPQHLSTRTCMVFNDFYIHSYNRRTGKVEFTTDLKNNFFNEGK
jgi:hypothetical protein